MHPEKLQKYSHIIHKTINTILRMYTPQKKHRHHTHLEGILTSLEVWSWVLVPIADFCVTLDMRLFTPHFRNEILASWLLKFSYLYNPMTLWVRAAFLVAWIYWGLFQVLQKAAHPHLEGTGFSLFPTWSNGVSDNETSWQIDLLLSLYLMIILVPNHTSH